MSRLSRSTVGVQLTLMGIEVVSVGTIFASCSKKYLVTSGERGERESCLCRERCLSLCEFFGGYLRTSDTPFRN